MSEPTTTAAGGFALWKLFGGLAGFAAVAAFLATIVSMCMMTPRNAREWAVGIISTVMCSLCGGAYAILRLGLLHPLPTDPQAEYLAVLTALGVVFACGLPGWAVVRAVFTWLIKRQGKDIGELVADARADVSKAVAP